MLEKLFSFPNSCLKGGGGLFNIFSILGDLRNFWQNIHPCGHQLVVQQHNVDVKMLIQPFSPQECGAFPAEFTEFIKRTVLNSDLSHILSALETFSSRNHKN